MTDRPFPASDEEVRTVWEENAPFWDERMAEGNAFHRHLVAPVMERLLDLRSGERVLDVACGNGQLARRMAALGATVVACDFSAGMIEHARARTAARPELVDRIDYRIVDATDEGQLGALGEGEFDAATCAMALMDMSAIEPLYRALPRLLRPGGRFVFTITHPCFNNTGARLFLEEETRDGELVVTRGVRVTTYLGLRPARGVAMRGQPRPQWYFDRSLTGLLGPAFAAGLVVDGLEEAAFTDATADTPFSWENFPEIPPLLAVRLRVRTSS